MAAPGQVLQLELARADHVLSRAGQGRQLAAAEQGWPAGRRDSVRDHAGLSGHGDGLHHRDRFPDPLWHLLAHHGRHRWLDG